jgi:hypothetical protein
MKMANGFLCAGLFLSLAMPGCPFFKARELETQVAGLKEELAETRKNLDAANISLEYYKQQYVEKAQAIMKLQEQIGELRAKIQEMGGGVPGEAIPREVFSAKAVGMTPQELSGYVGKPTTTFGEKGEWWYYENGITYDPVARKRDGRVQILFGGGRVKEVYYK